jgi:hypothetical protein
LLICFGNNGSGSGQTSAFTVSGSGEILDQEQGYFSWSTYGISFQICPASGSVSSTMSATQPANYFTILFSTTSPPSIGNVGDFYLNLTTGELWGPKGTSGWAASGLKLVAG